MNCKFKYLSSANSWVTYGNLVRPVPFGDTIKNETISAYSIRLYFKGESEITKEALTPGTICRIDFGTKQFDYVIVDGGKIDNKSGVDYCYHSYTIQELLAYTREIFIQNAFFTQGEYTLAEFFTRLLALSESDRTIVLNTNEDYNTLAENYDYSEYQIASNSLLDNLIKIGQRYNVRVKARINTSFQLELYFKNLKGSEIATINGVLINRSNQYLGANYAANVISLATNMTNGELSWYPHLDAIKGLRVEPESDSLTIEPNTAVLKLLNKIKNATKVRVAGFGQIITNSVNQWIDFTGQDYRVFDMEDNRIYPDAGKYVNIDWDLLNVESYTDVNVIPHERWKMLDPDDSNSAIQHQENTLYFKPEDNKVYNMKICDGDSSIFGANPIGYVEVWYGGAKISTTYVYPLLKWHLNRYIVLASYYVDTLISIGNGMNSKRVAFYDQEDNIVSSNSLLKNLKNYIDSMKNEELSPTYRFDSIDNIPIVGSIINGMVISQITANAYYDKIEASISLSDDIVKKSEYLSADAGLSLPKVDIDKAFNRFKASKTRLWFCQNSTEASGLISIYGADNKYQLSSYFDKILDSMKNGRVSAPLAIASAELKLGDIYTSLTPTVISADNALMVMFKTINNVVIGYSKDNTIGDDYSDIRYYPIAFNDGSKQQALRIKFKTTINIDANYPAITSTRFNSDVGKIIDVIDNNYHHDPNEVINLNYIIEGKSTKLDGFVKKEYWDESSILADFYSEPDKYTRTFTMWNDPTGTTPVAIFGENITVGNVAITYLGNAIAKINIEIPSGNIPPGFSIPAIQNSSYVVIKRRNNISSDYQDLLKTKCEVTENSGTYYITYYVAFTK